jgi:hypothetical protein
MVDVCGCTLILFYSAYLRLQSRESRDKQERCVSCTDYFANPAVHMIGTPRAIFASDTDVTKSVALRLKNSIAYHVV